MTDQRDLFFNRYPELAYDRTNSSPREFYRMSSLFGWNKLPDGSYPAAREDSWKGFRKAMSKQLNSSFGTNVEDIATWQGLGHFLNLDPLPSGVEDIRQTHVNLSDLLASERIEGSVKTFHTRDELVEFNISEGRYFPKEEAFAGGLLKYLLREIHQFYQGNRD
ncbi:hypothetical protein LTR95_001023 [Oleoguttula sp. CCFEE 5521]